MTGESRLTEGTGTRMVGGPAPEPVPAPHGGTGSFWVGVVEGVEEREQVVSTSPGPDLACQKALRGGMDGMGEMERNGVGRDEVG